MPLLLIKNLKSYPDILPLLIVKKKERLRVKQIRKGALKRKQTKCTNCLQLGYNKRRCVAQLARNRRAKRLRDWNRDILSDSNLDKSALEESSDSELERELAPFVEQVRAKAKAKVKAILVARDELSDSGDEVRACPPSVQGSPALASPALASPVRGSPAPASPVQASPALALPASPLQLRPKPKRARKLSKASLALEPRPKRAQKLPKRYC
jgi:hypothetical protein